MNKNSSVLEFDNYYIDEFVFKKNEKFTKDQDQKINVDLNFEFDTVRNQNDFKRIVTCYIFDQNYIENNKPFYLKLKINGIFSLADYDEKNRNHRVIIKKNT
ncbi:MAG: hypothetical protein ACOCV1_05455 [Bacillota bacterium]